MSGFFRDQMLWCDGCARIRRHTQTAIEGETKGHYECPEGHLRTAKVKFSNKDFYSNDERKALREAASDGR